MAEKGLHGAGPGDSLRAGVLQEELDILNPARRFDAGIMRLDEPFSSSDVRGLNVRASGHFYSADVSTAQVEPQMTA